METLMTFSTVYAVISTTNLDRAREWYARLFGRESDRQPMTGVCEWHFGSGGVQVVADPQRAGCSMFTLIVSSLERTRADLLGRRLTRDPSSGGDMTAIAQIRDLGRQPDHVRGTGARTGSVTLNLALATPSVQPQCLHRVDAHGTPDRDQGGA
jgi:hypothetical protein